MGRSKGKYDYISKETKFEFDKGGRAFISKDGNQIDILISGNDSVEDSAPIVKLKRKELEYTTESRQAVESKENRNG